jgi:hypothetical protein
MRRQKQFNEKHGSDSFQSAEPLELAELAEEIATAGGAEDSSWCYFFDLCFGLTGQGLIKHKYDGCRQLSILNAGDFLQSNVVFQK